MKGLLRFDTGVTGGENMEIRWLIQFFLTYLSLVFFSFSVPSFTHYLYYPKKRGEENFWFILFF